MTYSGEVSGYLEPEGARQSDCRGTFLLVWDADRGTVEGEAACEIVEGDGDLLIEGLISGTADGDHFEGWWQAVMGPFELDLPIEGDRVGTGWLVAEAYGETEAGVVYALLETE